MAADSFAKKLAQFRDMPDLQRLEELCAALLEFLEDFLLLPRDSAGDEVGKT